MKSLRHIPIQGINNTLTKIFCRHKHTRIETSSGKLLCNDCNADWPISDELLAASGVFERINERIEADAEYRRLLKMAEDYLTDNDYNQNREGR